MYRPVVVTALLLSSFVLAGCMGGTPNGAPAGPLEALFVYSPMTPQVGEAIDFVDVSNGSAVSWDWQFGDGESGQGKEVQHTYATAGVYEVRLQVRDPQGREDDASRFVQVGGGTAPIGGLRVDIRYAVSDLSVDFEPVVVPKTANVEQFFWDFGDGETSKQPAPLHTYGRIGEYVVELRIATGEGVAKATKRVAVGVESSDGSGLAARSFTVIAIVDSGVNPYHDEFAASEFQDHPSTYITGYPAEAMPLEVSLDARTYTEALKQDDETWDEVKKSKLYWIPGTRIIGAISVEPRGERRILDDGDDEGHGTATASDAAGATVGACPQCLIVVVEGLGDGPLNWALSQPWIDIVSNSWTAQYCVSEACAVSTNLAPPVLASAAASKAAVEAGKTVLFAAGNGALNFFESPQMTYWSAHNGPDWIVTVGAADAKSGATVAGTGRPVDVVSYGLDWKAASHNSKSSIRSFGGTSAATPIIAGAFGQVLLQARQALNDTQEGPHARGIVAEGPALKGMLSDGRLTRAELERALYTTAKPASGAPIGEPPVLLLPHSPAAFAYAGYGIIDAKTAVEAYAVVSGGKPVPVRSNEDAWAAVDSEVRQAIWGSYNPGLDAARPAPEDLAPYRSAWMQFVLG